VKNSLLIEIPASHRHCPICILILVKNSLPIEIPASYRHCPICILILVENSLPLRFLHISPLSDLHTHPSEEPQDYAPGSLTNRCNPHYTSTWGCPPSLATARVRVAIYSLSTIEWKWLIAYTCEPEYSGFAIIYQPTIVPNNRRHPSTSHTLSTTIYTLDPHATPDTTLERR